MTSLSFYFSSYTEFGKMTLSIKFALVLFVIASCYAHVIFEDAFDGGEIDDSKWKFEQTLSGGGDWQFQWFVKDKKNAFIENGVLHIRPTLTSDAIGGENQLKRKKVDIPANECTSSFNYGCSRHGSNEHILNPIRSASIQSKVAFKFGTVEICAKLPAGDWLRPSIKLLPKDNKYGNWPASGEIDLVEARGNRELYDENMEPIGINRMTSTLHYGPSWDANGWEKMHFVKTSSNGFNEDFHIFKLDWSKDGIKFFVDGEEIGNFDVAEYGDFWKAGDFEVNGINKPNPWSRGTSMAPFDQEFFISIGLAVGGVNNYFSDDFENRNYQKPWNNNSPKAPLGFWNAKNKWLKTWTKTADSADFQIDYVKVFGK